MAEQITFELVGGGTKVLPCIPTMLSEGMNLIAGGFESEIKLAINIRRSHFLTSDSTEITVDTILFTADDDSPPPSANKFCTFRGKRFQIVTAGEDGTRAYVKMTFKDADSKR